MRRRWGVLVAAALVGAACGGGEEGGPEAGGAVLTPVEARFGTVLWQARGHHLVSLELYRAGDAEGALAHAAHAVDEVFPSVEGEIADHDPGAADDLRAALADGQEAVARDASEDELEAAYDEALEALRRAEAAVVADPSSPAYLGSVVAGLTATAAHEYEEAVAGGALGALEEYQDAYGFLSVAKDLFAEIGPSIEAEVPEEAEEIEEAFETLGAALPSVGPPARLVPAEDVERAAFLVGAELQETVGALVARAVEPDEVWENIELLLGQILEEYEEGEAGEAAELAARAYLENYELIEAEVIEHAPDINAELEPLLGAEIRARIREGVAPEDLGRLVARARQLIAQARQALEEAG